MLNSLLCVILKHTDDLFQCPVIEIFKFIPVCSVSQAVHMCA